MMDCLREQEILEAVAAARLKPRLTTDTGRKPAVVEPGCPADIELEAHLAECSSCADVAQVAFVLRDEQDVAWHEAAVPTADVVWLRAQLRARAEATRLASRPITIVQALGIACAAGVVAGLMGTTAWWLRSWAAWLSSAAAVVASGPGTLEIAGLAARGVLLALSVWLVLAPVAVYLAATED